MIPWDCPVIDWTYITVGSKILTLLETVDTIVFFKTPGASTVFETGAPGIAFGSEKVGGGGGNGRAAIAIE